MEYLKVHDWNEWQTYRNDRGMPPWIKIHRCLMRDVKWVSLSCQQRGQLIAIWLLAADHDGVIPDDAALVRKLCYMDEDPDLNAFVSMGLLDRDAKVAPTRRQGGANVTPTRRQRDALETETETEKEIDICRSTPSKTRKTSGTRITHETLPDNWRLWALNNIDGIDPVSEFDKFRDHWLAQAGARARKVDWLAAWRTWMRNARDWNKNGSNKSRQQTGPAQAHKDFPDD